VRFTAVLTGISLRFAPPIFCVCTMDAPLGTTGTAAPTDGVAVAARNVALITGITGQDGSYLAELLLGLNYEVHGIIRRTSSFNTGRIEHLRARVTLHYGDLSDGSNLMATIAKVRPTELYNLAAQTHVAVSFAMPEFTGDIDGLGTLRLLDAIRALGMERTCRFYQASTSELYGKVVETPQTETTPFYPRSPYAVAKQYAFWIVKHYREAYGMHASNGILFNHESPRRGPTFVTRKITRAVARIARGLQKTLFLGNIDAKRDWGHARDYVEGMWRMLQQDAGDDFVLATGETHAVREFCTRAFAEIGVTLKWIGEGVDERGVDAADATRTLVGIDPVYFRPCEVDLLLGDPRKAGCALGWDRRTTFPELVSEMVAADLVLVDAGDVTS